MAQVMPILAQVPPAPASADSILGPYIYVFYASFLVAFLFTPIMKMVASFYGIIDEPDQGRKMHRRPIAYLGGVAVFLGWLCGLTLSLFLNLHRKDLGWNNDHPVIKFSIVLGAMIIIVLGLWDDIYGLSPRAKIAGQLVAAVFLLVDDVGVECTRSFLLPVIARIYPMLTGGQAFDFNMPPAWCNWLVWGSSGLLVILAVIGCCNATNLLDGMDGLCGGVTAIIAAGFLFVAVHLAMYGGGLNTNWDALRVILGLALLGAVLGFVPYNFNPASIFMGDTGSMFLGYCCSVMIVLMAQERAKWFLASMVMFALPVLDTALAFARRWIARRPLFSADAQHFHHQLVQRGYTVRQTVIISYGLAVGFALLGALIVYTRTRYAIAIYLVTFGSIIVAAYKMGMIHERPRGGTPSKLSDADSESATGNVGRGTVFEIPDKRGPSLPAQPSLGADLDEGDDDAAAMPPAA
jgi:UDP-GlcNAc:undecaprenyl-phosphate/decaprenyl-phosphate GlcNAc-1-phosphate transferase